ADEENHIDFLETQLALHDRVGAENYAKLNASRMDEST
ncbi:MAG: bacterioferritin, partial [Rhodobacter sp.]|nr:bacterioferritin [Rhodobacter sp.]